MAISLCSSTNANTGVIQCDTGLGIIRKIIIWNGSVAISSINTNSTFQTFFENASKLSKNDSNKAFVFPDVLDIVDNTEANTTGSLNQGVTVVLREGRGAYTLKMAAGQSLVPRLRKFNNQNVRVLILDSNNNVWGVESGTSFQGIQAQLFTSGLRFADGQAVKEGIVDTTVSFLSASELNDSAAFGTVVTAAGLKGLIDVQMVSTAAVAANVYKIGGTIDTAKAGASINLFSAYSTELANAALWVAKTGPTYSTTIAITSVSLDAANSGWTVTLDSTAHTALASGTKISINLAAPQVLDAAGVSELEGLAYLTTKP